MVLVASLFAQSFHLFPANTSVFNVSGFGTRMSVR